MSILKKIDLNLKQLNIQAMNPKVEHRLFLCFLGGLVLGTVLLNVFGVSYDGDVVIYSEYLASNGIADNQTIDKLGYAVYCFKNYMCEFGVIFLLNLTPFGKVFNSIYLCYKGLVAGMLISAATYAYGAGGLFLYLVSIFPHYIAYVPFVIGSIYVSMKMTERIKEKSRKVNIRALLIIIALSLITAALEAYGNYPIISFIFS